jgi:predicted DNA-binding transcriptional regulator YafY
VILADRRVAVADERRVRLRYRDRGGATTNRLVDPLGLVAKAGIWYLVARDPAKGYRTFRAERIVAVVRTAETFARPSDFKLDAYWQTSLASLERQVATTYDVTLRVRTDAVDRVTSHWTADVLGEERDSTILRVSFPHVDLAVVMVLALGDAATVVEPTGIRASIVSCARAAIARHAPPPVRARRRSA